MPDYGKNAVSARAAIRRAGKVVIMSVKTGGGFDPVESETIGSKTVNYNIAAVILPATIARFRGIDNKLVESGNLVITKGRYLILPTSDESGVAIPEPLPEFTFQFFGSTWKCLGCSPLNPAGIPILYQVGVLKV